MVNGVESQHALCQSLGLYQIGLELGFSVTLLIKCHILHRKNSISFTPLDATLKYHTKGNARSVRLEGNVFRFGRVVVDQSRYMGFSFSVEAGIAESYILRVYFSIDIMAAADALCGKA